LVYQIRKCLKICHLSDDPRVEMTVHIVLRSLEKGYPNLIRVGTVPSQFYFDDQEVLQVERFNVCCFIEYRTEYRK